MVLLSYWLILWNHGSLFLAIGLHKSMAKNQCILSHLSYFVRFSLYLTSSKTKYIFLFSLHIAFIHGVRSTISPIRHRLLSPPPVTCKSHSWLHRTGASKISQALSRESSEISQPQDSPAASNHQKSKGRRFPKP